MPEKLTIIAPAKVNLNLNITGKREDGYHLLDSIVVFTAFGDHLEVAPAEADIVTMGGRFANSLSAAGDNICLHALSAYRAAGGAAGPLAIHIDKQIPVGAGLGGGSSDAAAILRHLNTMSGTPLSEDRLAAVALTIGADVPVCLAGTVQRMQGSVLCSLARQRRKKKRRKKSEEPRDHFLFVFFPGGRLSKKKVKRKIEELGREFFFLLFSLKSPLESWPG